MAQNVLVLLGTKKGAFILDSDAERRVVRPARAVLRDLADEPCGRRPARGTIYAGGGNEWFGPAVWSRPTSAPPGPIRATASPTRRATSRSSRSGASPPVTATPLCRRASRRGCSAATMAARPGSTSPGLRDHPSRPQWQPGGGGLILHSLVPHPSDHGQLWVGISAAGVFHTADGGETWEPRNRGTRADFLPEGQRYPEFGQCVHCLVMAPGMPDRLYQQNHCGMYRSDDGGRQLGEHRGGPAVDLRLPGGGPPARPRHALPAAAQRRHGRPLRAGRPRPRSGARATAARAGRRCATACRRRTPSSACCARRWRPTAWTRPGSISARAPARSIASADEGESWTCIAAAPADRSFRSKPWSIAG